MTLQLRRGWSAFRAFLLPGQAEDDPRFKEKIRHRSIRGVYIIADVTAFMPLLGLVFHGLANLFDADQQTTLDTLVLIAVAGSSVSVARTAWGHKYARLLAFASDVAVAVTLACRSREVGLVHGAPGDSRARRRDLSGSRSSRRDAYYRSSTY